jgi:hypothetical protein
MIQDDIIKELQYIPETKLTELFDIIHSFRLRFNNEIQKQPTEDDELKIDVQACLQAFKKIESGDRSELIEIGDIDDYIEKLRHEIN